MLNKNIERIVQDIEDSETIHNTLRPAAATGDEAVTVTKADLAKQAQEGFEAGWAAGALLTKHEILKAIQEWDLPRPYFYSIGSKDKFAEAILKFIGNVELPNLK